MLVGAGHQMFHFGNPRPSSSSPAGVPRALPVDKLTLFERVARQNGPLEDYHPQNLLQCLLWGVFDAISIHWCVMLIFLALQVKLNWSRM